MEFLELMGEMKKFAEGRSSLDIVKECFHLFWDNAHREEMKKEYVAKAESLHIALEALEVGYFSREHFFKFIKSFSA